MATRTVTCQSCGAEQNYELPEDFEGRSVRYDCSSCQTTQEDVVNESFGQAPAEEQLPEGTVGVADAEAGSGTTVQG